MDTTRTKEEEQLIRMAMVKRALDKSKELLGYQKIKGKDSYQLYDKITYQETDDASNFTLEHFKKNALYYTNILDKQKTKHYFFVKQKDYAGNDLVIPLLEMKDFSEKILAKNRRHGYFHISHIQMVVKFLGATRIDIPLKVDIRDRRIEDVKQSIIGLISSNLYSGQVLINIVTDITLSAKEQNLTDAISIHIEPHIKIKNGSYSVSVKLQYHALWMQENSPCRRRDEVISPEGIEKGQAIILLTKDCHPSTVPKPIPINELTYDLDFDFEKTTLAEVGSTSKVDFVSEGIDTVKVRLEKPTNKMHGQARRIVQEDEDFNLGLSDDEQEKKI